MSGVGRRLRSALQESARLLGFLFQAGPGRGSVLLSLCFWKNWPLGRAWVWMKSLLGLGRMGWGWLQDQGLYPVSVLVLGTPEESQAEDHIVLGSLYLIPEQHYLWVSRAGCRQEPRLMVHCDWLSPGCYCPTYCLSLPHWDKEAWKLLCVLSLTLPSNLAPGHSLLLRPPEKNPPTDLGSSFVSGSPHFPLWEFSSLCLNVWVS